MHKGLETIFQTVDALMLTTPHHLRCFTGFCGGEGVAILHPDGGCLLVDSRYTEEAERETKNVRVIEYSASTRDEEVQKILSAHGVKTLGFEEAGMTVQAYRQWEEAVSSITWVGCSKALDQCRMIKSEEELCALRQAEQIGVDAFLRVLSMIRPGVRENEIAAEIEYQMRKSGAEGVSFETIVVSGVKTSMPHGKPDDKKIENGDLVTMDFGCVKNGYCSDMTRTVVVGKADQKQKEIYETVRKAQTVGLEIIRAGITGAEADAAARKVIDDAGYGAYFGHSLGHGVGLLIHELPNLSSKSDIVLQEGMVVTCEPGIYIPHFGGVRIEDMVCVTKDGIENLTHLSKDLIEL